MKRKVLGLLLVVFAVVRSQSIPADRENLLSGEGMGQASYAEMNGFPGPKHVMELKADLSLTPDQVKKTEGLIQGVLVGATTKGEEIVEAEESLNKAFAAGSINEKQLRARLEQIGKLRAELRFVHLQAHLKMKQILAPSQIARYGELRGHAETKSNTQ